MRTSLWGIAALAAAISLGSCASQRLDIMVPKYSESLSNFHIREVLSNLGYMIDNPYFIPRDTTVAGGELTFTDTSSLSVSAISINKPAGTGTFSGTLGGFVDSYKVNVTADNNPARLQQLQALYLEALYPRHRPRWLYWNGGPEPIPESAISLGVWGGHEIWTTSPAMLNKLVLKTLTPATGAKAKSPKSSTQQLLINPQGGVGIGVGQ